MQWLCGILGFNWFMYGIAASFPEGQRRGSGPAAGLLWVTIKLFVNTLTIFFVIGLHVGYDPLFLPLFLTGFVLLMIGGIAMMQLKHVRQTRAISSHE